jgi:hypothetical protein
MVLFIDELMYVVGVLQSALSIKQNPNVIQKPIQSKKNWEHFVFRESEGGKGNIKTGDSAQV